MVRPRDCCAADCSAGRVAVGGGGQTEKRFSVLIGPISWPFRCCAAFVVVAADHVVVVAARLVAAAACVLAPRGPRVVLLPLQ
mmetsp:Transcript_37315/g.97816  ORF Transcript_37315/g.97816 Transcript_37315/m.97816 type:complete len:83 (+) Transcript_37315:1475-1723(+)